MFFHEKIDGIIDDNYAKYRDHELARGLIRKIGTFGGWMVKEDPSENHPQSYRLGTFVEAEDSRFGHALTLSKPQRIHHTIAEFSIKSLLYKVDREKHHIVEGPKILDVVTTRETEDQITDTPATYDRDEMIFCHGMLDKMKILKLDARFGDDIDKHVALGLALEHADTLAEQNPSPR